MLIYVLDYNIFSGCCRIKNYPEVKFLSYKDRKRILVCIYHCLSFSCTAKIFFFINLPFLWEMSIYSLRGSDGLYCFCQFFLCCTQLDEILQEHVS